MQKPFRLKQLVLLLGLLFPAVWCSADDTYSISTDDHSSITIKNGNVQGTPKGSSIQATEVDTWITYGYRHYDPVTGQFLIYTSFETDQDSVCLSHDEMEYYYQNILDIYHQQPFGKQPPESGRERRLHQCHQGSGPRCHQKQFALTHGQIE